MSISQKFLNEFDLHFNVDIIEIDNHAWMMDEAALLGDTVEGWSDARDVREDLEYILSTKKISSVMPFIEKTGVDWLADPETTTLFFETITTIRDRITGDV